VIADPSGALAVNTSGSPWLATAGSGDVLTGMIGSLLAARLQPLRAAALAAHLHGRAGERAALAGRPGASALLEFLH
jgi:NAD(P)H-hydrate repair Nnr-like enzyme with NAD(P)H-hydrate dehydratase domain